MYLNTRRSCPGAQRLCFLGLNQSAKISARKPWVFPVKMLQNFSIREYNVSWGGSKICFKYGCVAICSEITGKSLPVWYSLTQWQHLSIHINKLSCVKHWSSSTRTPPFILWPSGWIHVTQNLGKNVKISCTSYTLDMVPWHSGFSLASAVGAM